MLKQHNTFHLRFARGIALLTLTASMVGCEKYDTELEDVAMDISNLQQALYEQAEVLDALREENVQLKAEIEAIHDLGDIGNLFVALADNTDEIARLNWEMDNLANTQLTAVDLNGYATELWVQGQGYAVETDVIANGAQIDKNSADLATNANKILALRSDVTTNTNDIAHNQTIGTQNKNDVAANTTKITVGTAAITSNTNKISSNSSDISTLQTTAADADDLFTYVNVDSTNNTIAFVGANVHIQSGSGSTDDGGTLTGLGNLVIGYDEDDSDDKTGSHNLVIGPKHSYSSFSGMVVGYNNTIEGEYSTITGGADNSASGDRSSVSGGYAGTASGWYSSVSGGNDGTASGAYSSVYGGNSWEATGYAYYSPYHR